MADKKVTPPLGAYPGAPPQPQAPFLPTPPQHAGPQYGMATGSPYGMAFGGAGGAGGATQLYAAPPPYEQTLQHHQPLGAIAAQQLGGGMYCSPGAAMYSYPGYMGYPLQYYPYYQAAMQPSIQQLRPTIMIPNGFEGGARFDGVGAPMLPPAPPGVPHTPAQLAAMAGHPSFLFR